MRESGRGRGAVRGRLRNRILTGLAVVAAAAAVAVGPALSASAHDYLVSSTPAAGSTQTTALTKVVLTFDDRVLDLSGDGSSNVVEVTNTAGKHFETGCAAIADTNVSIPVALGGSGKYTVTWQIVSADGHVVSSSIAFDYRLPAGVTAAAGGDSRPSCGGSSGSTGSSSAASTSAGGSSAGGSSGAASGTSALGPALGIGGGVVVLAIIAVVIVLVRNRRPTAPPE